MNHRLHYSNELQSIIEEIENQIFPIHREIDRMIEINQYRVLKSFQDNRVSDTYFTPSTGYGYGDIGRDALEKIYADVFGAEAGLVRPQIISGTHAISIALFGVLRPGDELLYITGKPYDTLEEFLDYAKEHPGEIRVGNSGPGSIWHLASASVEKATGVQFSHVPFDGANPAVTALLGGHIEAVSVSPAEVLQYVEAGELKTLAILSEERTDAMPDVPTIGELGFGEVAVGPWRGLSVPKDTPKEIVDYLSEVFLKAAQEEEFISFMESNGLGIVLRDADEFADYLAQSDKEFGELISGLDLSTN